MQHGPFEFDFGQQLLRGSARDCAGSEWKVTICGHTISDCLLITNMESTTSSACAPQSVLTAGATSTHASVWILQLWPTLEVLKTAHTCLFAADGRKLRSLALFWPEGWFARVEGEHFTSNRLGATLAAISIPGCRSELQHLAWNKQSAARWQLMLSRRAAFWGRVRVVPKYKCAIAGRPLSDQSVPHPV